MVHWNRIWARTLVVSATCAMLCPPVVLAGDPPAVIVSSTVIDIKLSEDSVLRGTAMSAAGNAQAGAMVTLAQSNQSVATAQANEQGQFGFRLAKGGMYQLAVGEQVLMVRAWSAKMAPPAAKPELLVVTQTQLARGQRPLGEALFSTPVLLGLVIAAAIAIPLALKSNDNPSGS